MGASARRSDNQASRRCSGARRFGRRRIRLMGHNGTHHRHLGLSSTVKIAAGPALYLRGRTRGGRSHVPRSRCAHQPARSDPSPGGLAMRRLSSV